MRRRRDERDTGNGVTRLGDDVVDLEAGQLSALTGFRTLSHLDLYLFCIYQILCRHAKTSAGYLLRLTAQTDTVHFCVIAGIILTALASVASSAKFVHGQRQCLMGLNTQGTETHRTSHEMLHDALYGLYLVNGRGLVCTLEAEEVADEDRRFLLVDEFFPLLELLIAALPCGQLQLGNCLRVPGVLDAVFAPGKQSVVLQRGGRTRFCLQTEGIAGNLFQSDAADGAHLRAEITAQQILTQSDALKDLRTAIGADGRDAHLTHDLLQTFVYGLDVVRLCRRIFFLYLAVLHQVVEDGEGHIWT